MPIHTIVNKATKKSKIDPDKIIFLAQLALPYVHCSESNDFRQLVYPRSMYSSVIGNISCIKNTLFLLSSNKFLYLYLQKICPLSYPPCFLHSFHPLCGNIEKVPRLSAKD